MDLSSSDTSDLLQNNANMLTLSGATLQVSAASTSTAGQVFTIINSAATSGTFTSLPDGTAFTGANGRRYVIHYTTTTATLTDTPLTAPTVTAPTVTSITGTTATLGGTVSSDGGAALTEVGVVYALTSVNSNPQLGGAGVTVVDAASFATGLFTVNASGLLASGAYSFAAFASNSVGTTYTNPVSTFTTSAASVSLGLTGSPFAEAGGTATLTASLTAASALPLTISLSFAGTAFSGTDYNPSATSITIAAGQLSGSITLTGLNNAATPNGATVIVTVQSGANYTVGSPSSVTATITAVPPPPTNVPDKIGTVRVGPDGVTLQWSLDSNGNGVWEPGVDQTLNFGHMGDITFVGDWLGTGFDEAGVARVVNGSLSGTLDMSGVGNNAMDIQFSNFGAPGDTILVGDWDGSGHDSIAVARPDGQGGFNGTFALIQNGRFVPGVNFFGLGDAAGLPVSGSQIVAGDWTSSGRDGLAVARNNGQGSLEWLLYTTNPGVTGTALDTVFSTFGFPGDTALSGQWTGSASQVGVFRSPSTPAQWSLDKSGNGQYAAVDAAFFGYQGDSPIVGDWNASGTSKIGVYRTSGPALAFTLDSNGDGVADAGDLNAIFGHAGDSVVIGKWNPAL